MITWIPIIEGVDEYQSLGSLRYAVKKKWIASKKIGGRIFISKEHIDQINELVKYCDGKREWGPDLEVDHNA